MSSTIKVGISCGDLHGIGLEVALKALIINPLDVVIYAPKEIFDHYGRLAGQARFEVADLGRLTGSVQLGRPTSESSRWAIQSLKASVDALINGKIDALVTAPIDKYEMEKQGFGFPGHTEYLASMAGGIPHLMLMTCESLRMGTITGHLPLSSVASNITAERIKSKCRIMHQSLIRDFDVDKPRIAVLGLNPHAGDKGKLGSEEDEIIRPAINDLLIEGLDIYGPKPADGFFGSKEYQQFDGILSMYHDQGLVPFKLLSFGKGVNFTAGLPFVRTSPDHGTAFSIAGRNKANEGSFLAALNEAASIVKKRRKG